MAKEIRAIECPKCGSTQKVAVRPDVYRCESCNTEYFLDSDDVNVNYTVRHEPPPAPASRLSPRVLAGLVGGGAVLLTLALRHGPSASYEAADTPVVVMAAPGSPAPAAKSAAFRFSSATTALYARSGQAPGLLAVGRRDYEEVGPDSSYLVFRDGAAGTVLRSVALPLPPADRLPDVELKQLTSGELYLLVDKTKVFRINPATYSVTDVSKSLFQPPRELSSGVATVEAADDDEGDGFKVFTNDGRNLQYYPLIHRTYDEDGFYAARHGMASLRPGSPRRTGFVFSRKSTTYPNEKVQLIRYTYRDNGPGPKALPSFEWDDDYGNASGIFTSDMPHQKVLTTPRELANDRVLDYRDLTPGRTYYDAAIRYSDEDVVLLTLRATAAPDSPQSLQGLNARTGAILFTLPLPADADNLHAARRYAGGYVLANDQHAFAVSTDGQLLHHFPLD